MNKKIIFLSAVLFSAVMSAQVKIGGTDGTPNPNAMLEVQATNKGILLPRVALTSTAAFAPLSGHVQGMTVYNTATINDVTPGQYYNDGTKWNRIANTTDIPPVAATITANNGLTKTGNNITLGGPLTTPTTINATAPNNLILTGLSATTAAQLPTDKIIVQDAAGTLKTANVSDFARTRNTTVFKTKVGNGQGVLNLSLISDYQNLNFNVTGSTGFYNGTTSPISSTGTVTIQESGVYAVGFYFRYGSGVNLALLDLLSGGFSGIRINKNGVPLESKAFSGVNLSLNVVVNIGILNLVISNSEINTIYQFNAGDQLTFQTRLGGLASLSLLSGSEGSYFMYKISDL